MEYAPNIKLLESSIALDNESIALEGIFYKAKDVIAHVDTINKLREGIKSTLGDKNGLDPISAELIRINLENIYSKIGIDIKYTIPSMESFKYESSRVVVTNIAIESIRSKITDIYEWIKKLFTNMITRIKNFFKRLFGYNTDVTEECEKKEKEIEKLIKEEPKDSAYRKKLADAKFRDANIYDALRDVDGNIGYEPTMSLLKRYIDYIGKLNHVFIHINMHVTNYSAKIDDLIKDRDSIKSIKDLDSLEIDNVLLFNEITRLFGNNETKETKYNLGPFINNDILQISIENNILSIDKIQEKVKSSSDVDIPYLNPQDMKPIITSLAQINRAITGIKDIGSKEKNIMDPTIIITTNLENILAANKNIEKEALSWYINNNKALYSIISFYGKLVSNSGTLYSGVNNIVTRYITISMEFENKMRASISPAPPAPSAPPPAPSVPPPAPSAPPPAHSVSLPKIPPNPPLRIHTVP